VSTHAEDKKDKLEDIEAGSHMINWDMKYPDAESFEGMIMWAGSLSGPTAPPGSYEVEMIHNGSHHRETFGIKGNPTLELTEQDYQGQFEFVQSVNAKVTEAHKTIKEIRAIKKQMSPFKEQLKDHKDVVEQITNIDSTLSVIEKELYQTKNRSRQDPLNFPIRLTNKLAHLNALTQRGSFPPTVAAIAVRDQLVGLIDAQLARYNAIKSTDIPSLNELIRSKKVDYIHLED